MPEVECWDHDAHTFNIYSDGTVVARTPFPAGEADPIYLLAMDPESGLPARYPMPARGSSLLPPGTRGDLLWYDGTGWVPLDPAVSAGELLTATGTAAPFDPAWVAPDTGPPAGPTDDEVWCGMATALADALVRAYTVVASLTSCVVSAASGLFGTGEQALAQEGARTALGAVEVATEGWATVLEGVAGALATLALCFQLAPLSPQAVDAIRRCAFCTLRATGSTTTEVDDAWRLAWSGCIGDNASAFTTVQALLLQGLINSYFPVEWWRQWTRQGSYAPSATCSLYSCS